MEWMDVGRPGYFGKHRAAKYRSYDYEYGEGGWRICWRWYSPVDFFGACLLYEAAYVAFFKAHEAALTLLVTEAFDVYDDSPSNMMSGINYNRQETERTHIQDIAIRRAIVRIGRCFEGERILQIRDSVGFDSLSRSLSPGRVPFHLPGMIIKPELDGWWQPGSVESFYQSNKVLQIKDT